MIETERLELVLLSPRQLNMWAEDLSGLEAELSCRYEGEPLTGFFLEIVKGQVPKAERDPDNACWISFWLLIRKHDRTVVGAADFKNIPDGRGEVEIGYGLGREHENNGYMTEAVKAMCSWGLSQAGVETITAETELDGLASQRVLKRCGFKLCRQEETLWWELQGLRK